MRRGLAILFVALVAGLVSYGLTRLAGNASAPVAADEMTWLRKEFKLSDAQVAEIERLHAAYRPVCAEHCERILRARDALRERRDDASRQAELAQLERSCTKATLAHLAAVAAVMEPAQGRRFLAAVEPKVSQHGHAQPLGLK